MNDNVSEAELRWMPRPPPPPISVTLDTYNAHDTLGSRQLNAPRIPKYGAIVRIS